MRIRALGSITPHRTSPQLRAVCDTVMGDDGVGLYVPKELVPIYKNEVIPVADILTPNAYEAGQLTGIDIHTKEDAVKALAELHSISGMSVSAHAWLRPGAKTVVITSAVLDEDRDHIYLFASNKADSQQFYVPIPLLKVRTQ
ncbi:hypothetical protein SARC_04806 [Sphaeroforma arctica JP610]|uniref:pyridoxal kinase n=1 Tax=Sphaeroforma arctica JP610 TaxID=667725 RepID=A0A0L0G183_9EUKA|nr:hypothetical protein SARC_04806 [Sphaeroforma arctica JP610]KNC82912.1 hypothetical protein SARC_04806 [Sphaeroforma arctica JP610]|eukprot:XP_014156814.1 hypothetical protein SARC_04806 [Sphaeroforma arctica JP610]